jgi:hypothetical protein
MSSSPVYGPVGDDGTSRSRRGQGGIAGHADTRDVRARRDEPGATDYSQEEILDMIVASRIGRTRTRRRRTEKRNRRTGTTGAPLRASAPPRDLPRAERSMSWRRVRRSRAWPMPSMRRG